MHPRFLAPSTEGAIWPYRRNEVSLTRKSIGFISRKIHMHCRQTPMSRIQRAVASGAFVLVLPVAATGCGGRYVDLGEDKDHPIEPDVLGPGVSVVAEDQQDAIEVVVDEEHLVWRSRLWDRRTAEGPYQPSIQPSYVRGCLKDDCMSTTITYAFGWIDSNVVANDGAVYWQSFVVPGPFNVSIFSCSTTGCIDSPRTVLSGMQVDSIAADEKHLYWRSRFDSAVLRRSLSGESKVEAVALNVLAEHVIVGDTHVYWDERAGNTRVIRRAPKAGDETPSTLVGDQAPGALAIDDKFVYWTAERADGAIFRCPLSGCEGAPTLLIADQQKPMALVTDGKTMTWVNVFEWGFGRGPDQARGSVLHCDVEACAATLETWSTQTFTSTGISLAADGTDVYWIAIRPDDLDPTDPLLRRTIYRHAY
jgi:hypothetical protein